MARCGANGADLAAWPNTSATASNAMNKTKPWDSNIKKGQMLEEHLPHHISGLNSKA
jgi:hypothetical protein